MLSIRPVLYLPFLLSFFAIHASCQKKNGPPAPAPQKIFKDSVKAVVLPTKIQEASGIAPGPDENSVWVAEDGGNPAALTLLKTDGKIIRTAYLESASNIDWEDLALTKVDGKELLYVGDIGDNNSTRNSIVFYVVPAPASNSTGFIMGTKKYTISYEDGPRDSEAFLVDPDSHDIYIFSKREQLGRLYKVSYPYSAGITDTARFVMELPYTSVTSASISLSGTELVLKNYEKIFYYQRSAGETVADVLSKTYTEIPYTREPQGEAICFDRDGSRMYTLSESPVSFFSQVLYIYEKK